MPNEEIIKFILLSQQSGNSKEEITQKLLQSGWALPDIQLGFESIEKATQPKAPSKYQDAYVVSPFKFIFFSIITINLYHVYWLYKQWEAIRKIRGIKIHSFWRTLIFIYLIPFGKYLNEIYSDEEIKKQPFGLLLFLSITVPITVSLVVFIFIHNLIVGSILNKLLIFDFFFYLLIQLHINKVYTKATGIKPSNTFSVKEIIFAIIFSLFLIINVFSFANGMATHYEKRVLYKNWTVYTGAKGDNFSIEMPTKKVTTTHVGEVNNYISTLNDETFELDTLPSANIEDTSQTYYDKLYLDHLNYMKHNPLFVLTGSNLKSSTGTYQNFPYSEYTIDMIIYKSKTRTLQAGALVYNLTYTSSFYSEEAYQKFVNSLKFIQQPSLVFSHFLTAHSYFVNGDYKKQLGEAQLALGLSTTNEDKAIAHYWIGLAYFKLNDMAQAETHLLQAVSLNTKYAGPYVTLSAIQSTNGNFQKGLEYALKCQSLDPKYAWCENNIALSLNGLGRREEALVHLQKAVSLDPDTFVFQDNLTRMKQQK